jgi:hypothetical protein
VQVAVLPAASVTVAVTFVTPVLKYEPEAGTKLTLVTRQLSVEVGAGSVIFVPAPAIDKLMFGVQAVITGFSLSVTVTVKEQVAVFPLASVTTKVFVVVPTGKTEPEAKPDVCTIVAPVQLSAKVGDVKLTIAPQMPGSLLTAIFAGQVMVGF